MKDLVYLDKIFKSIVKVLLNACNFDSQPELAGWLLTVYYVDYEDNLNIKTVSMVPESQWLGDINRFSICPMCNLG